MAQKDKIKELVGRGLDSYHTKSLQQIDRIEKKNKEQNHKISILSNELDNDYLTKTEEGSVISLEHSKEGMVYLDELQGNTLVNYCTDGAKELTLNGDIDVEGTFVTTTEGVDNGKVDIMCEGNTLVNLMPSINTTDKYYTLKAQQNWWTSTYRTYGEKLKPSTKYTLILDVLEYTLTSDNAFHVSVDYSNQNAFIEKINVTSKGLYIFTLTTKSDLIAGMLAPRQQIEKADDGHVKYREILLEGDWTNKEVPSYFEGMKSVGQDDTNGHKIEILSTTNNLLDLSLIDGLVEEGGKIVAKRTYNGSNSSLKLKPNTRYKVTMEKYDSNSAWIGFGYRINGIYTFIGNTNNQNNRVVEFTTPNEKDIIFCAGANGVNDIGHYLRLIKLEYANSSSNSSIAKHNKKEILLNEPLRGLPSGVKDKKVKIGNKWYIERKCKQETFDGSSDENWYVQNSNLENYSIFKLYVKNTPYGSSGGRINQITDIINSEVPTWSNLLNIEKECTHLYSDKLLYVKISNSKLDTQDVDGFIKWLKNNNINIVYELATPIYELLEVEPTLNTYNDITHISNNSIIPCNMKIQNTGYNAIIKPSTLYTVALDTNKNGTIGLNLGGAKVTTTNNVATTTTPATLTDDSLRLYGKGIKGSKVRLLEGDKTNWIPSYFEGMKSSFEDKFDTTDNTYKMEILSNNKNLMNFEVARGYSDNWEAVGGTGAHEAMRNKYPIQAKPNTKYCVEVETTHVDAKFYIRFFDENKKHIGGFTLFTYEKGGKYSSVFTSLNDKRVKYMNIHQWSSTKISMDALKYIKVAESSVIIEIPKHKSNKIQFSSIEPLRSVGDIKDRFVFKDSKLMIERNCRQAEGAELVYVRVHQPAYTDRFAIQASLNDCVKDHAKEGTIKCNKLPHKYNGFDVNYDCISSHKSNNGVYINLNKNMWGYNGSNGREILERYIRENNIILTVQKTEPIYEEIPFELQKIILEGYENGTLFIDTIIPPTVSTTYAGETPLNKSVRLNKTEVLNNTNDINDNIIPYLMDMDYRVVCLQLQSEGFNAGVAMARLFGGAYEMLQRDIQSKRYSVDEYKHRLDAYLDANKITEEEYNKLGDMLNE